MEKYISIIDYHTFIYNDVYMVIIELALINKNIFAKIHTGI